MMELVGRVTDEAEPTAGSLRYDLEGPFDAKDFKTYLSCSLVKTNVTQQFI
jgi:hypothetical protein